MNTFKVGQKVRVTEWFANVETDDGSFKSLVGAEGIVTDWSGMYYRVPVLDPSVGEVFPHLFTPEELEAV